MIARLQQLTVSIDKLEPAHHVNIGSILNSHRVVMNDAKTQVLINLSLAPEAAIEKIETYVAYATEQERVLAERDIMAEKMRLLLSPEN